MTTPERRHENMMREIAQAIEKGELETDFLKQAVDNAIELGISMEGLLELIEKTAKEIKINLRPMEAVIVQILKEEPIWYELTTELMERVEEGLVALVKDHAEDMAAKVGGDLSPELALKILKDVLLGMHSLIGEVEIKEHFQKALENNGRAQD